MTKKRTHWDTDKPTTLDEALELLRFGMVLNRLSSEEVFDTTRTEQRMINVAEFLGREITTLREDLEAAHLDHLATTTRLEAAEKRANEYLNTLDRSLVRLEAAGWPCRLEELPDEYVKMGQELIETRKKLADATEEIADLKKVK